MALACRMSLADSLYFPSAIGSGQIAFCAYPHTTPSPSSSSSLDNPSSHPEPAALLTIRPTTRRIYDLRTNNYTKQFLFVPDTLVSNDQWERSTERVSDESYTVREFWLTSQLSYAVYIYIRNEHIILNLYIIYLLLYV